MGNPDMRTPIANTLAWPERIDSGVAPLDLVEAGRLDFEYADFERFPCLRLAYEALKMGGTSTAILNAANEVAVEAFLKRKIRFTAIAELIERVLHTVEHHAADNLDCILADDAAAREATSALIAKGVGQL
jgi:1-deoxy-D-xylulose-5-phosphate reductoisomerase